MKKVLLGAAMAIAMTIGGGSIAQAEVYQLDVNHCTDCTLTNYGTITTTGEGTTSVTIAVSLATDVYFNQAGAGFDSFVWNLSGDPAITVGVLPSDWTAVGAQSAVSEHEDGLGFFDYKVNLAQSNNDSLCCQTLTFTITSLSALNFTSNLVDGKNVFFGVDVAQILPEGSDPAVGTGMIGATLCTDERTCGHEGGGGGPVPEPATWAMMLMGFGGLGAMLRRNRRQAALA
jgi:hypothetical protein